ncbi:MAG: cytochrome c [Proteobacteria bacterium]|jgi:cytochrome c556|nr:cytochrome c [Pseudomonadota bacterium]
MPPFAINDPLKMQRFTLVLLALLALTACQRSDPNSPTSLRKATFKEMLKSREAINGMLTGAKPYKADSVLQEAIKLQEKSTQPWAYFAEFTVNNQSDAKQKSDAADFHAAADNMQQQSSALKEAAQAGQEDRIRASYKAVEDACIRCHQQFRPG